MNIGIIPQYGFLFQRYVFIDIVISQMSNEKIFTYEGKDDIDISPNDQILSIAKDENKNQFVQVKSGIVQKECWAKIIGNWLLADITAYHKVIIENPLLFDPKSEEMVKYLCDYFKNGQNKRVNSIARKVYDKYITSSQEYETLKNDIININQSIDIEILPIQTLITKITETIKNIYCQDIKTYEKAKDIRTERLIWNINKDLDKKISEHNPFILDYISFMKYVTDVINQVSDKNYSVNTSLKLKKEKELITKEFIRNSQSREIKQLRLVKNDEGFIINSLARENLYKDFRDIYNGIEIINMEEIAFTNYDNARNELDDQATSKDLYFKTINKNIPSSILNNSPIYSNGCYIYLTGDNIEPEKQISWGNDDSEQEHIDS